MKRFLTSAAWAILFGWLFAAAAADTAAQTTAKANGKPAAPAVKVEKIDDARFRELIKPNGKPLLINFWATWCEPCREEFPDLVKLDAEYKGKIDFITVSLDFEEELATAVPQFLAEMKATMPSYLLITPDETAAIASVSKNWAGGLPFTILFDANGNIAYERQGLVKLPTMRTEIEKALAK